MALPHIIEYLLARPRGDGYLVSQAASQTIIPAVPPNTEFTLAEIPAGGDYAAIAYLSALSSTIVPNAFFGAAQYAGNLMVGGILDDLLVGIPLDSYVIISRKQPGILTIRNRTNLPQYYAGVVYFIAVKTEEDYKEILKELKRVGSQNLEGLAQEANQLLSALTQRLGAPRPPLGGS